MDLAMDLIQRRANVRTIPGRTFGGMPFTVVLDRAPPIDNGATAKIYKGNIHTSHSLAVSDTVIIRQMEPAAVAVKVFGQILSNVQQELVVRELQAARHLSSGHELILPFLGTADVGPQTAIVSLYMRNGNLMEYIKASKACDKNRLIRQVAEAVNFLHTERNLVHGDIKCANVLISDFGDALLADFGLSTFIEQHPAALPTMTAIRDMYTLRFAAPELITGGHSAGFIGCETAYIPTAECAASAVRPVRSKTCESDVYAFGMLVLEVVTESPPWHDLNHAEVVMRVSTGQHPPRPSTGALVTMSHAAWELCLDCWRMQPTDRIIMEDVLEMFKTGGLDIAPVRTMEMDEDIIAFAFMPSGRHVVTGDCYGGVHIFDTRTGHALGVMRAHTMSIFCLAASPTGLEVASGSRDNTIRRWDATCRSPIGEPVCLGAAPFCIAYSPDGRYLACGEGNGVRLWRADDAEGHAHRLRPHRLCVAAIAFSPDGARLASGSEDGTVRVWDVATRAALLALQEHKEVHSLAFSPDGASLAVAGRRHALLIWNVSGSRAGLELEIALEGHITSDCALAFSPTGACLVGSFDGAVRVWDARTGWPSGVRHHAGAYWRSNVSFSPDGRSSVSRVRGGGMVICDLFA